MPQFHKHISPLTIVLPAALGAIHLVLLGTVVWISLTWPYEHKDWGEWDMCYQTELISRGRNPYPRISPDHLTGIPYTFGMQLLGAPLNALFGAQLWTGRLLSILSFTGILLVTGLVLARNMHLPRFPVWTGVLLALASQSLTGHTFQKYHPNALCLLLGMFSLYFATLPGRGMKKWWIALAFALLAFYVKQTGIVFFAALSISGFLIMQEKMVVPFLTTLAAGIGIGYAANVATNGGFYAYCFEIPSTYRIVGYRLVHGAYFLLKNGFFFIAASIPWLLSFRRNYTNPVFWVTAFSCAAALFSYATTGGSVSNFAFALIPLSLTAAGGTHLILNKLSTPFWQYCIPLLLVAQLIIAIRPVVIPSRLDKSVIKEIERLIASSPGEIYALVHDMQAYKAGKTLYTPFNSLFQVRETGITSFPEIEKKISTHQFSLIIAPHLYLTDRRYGGDSIVRLLKKHYKICGIHHSGYYMSPVYLLKPETRAHRYHEHQT
ncbi:MAG: hypothetical protein GF401_08605 [Chitinivibrionales bacterium]|nr:hypothetical protein [Chitinivibrionales bacterium]